MRVVCVKHLYYCGITVVFMLSIEIKNTFHIQVFLFVFLLQHSKHAEIVFWHYDLPPCVQATVRDTFSYHFPQ